MTKVAVKCNACSAVLLIKKPKEGGKGITCPKCGTKALLSQLQQTEMKDVACPSCKALLAVDPRYKGSITCPKCKKSHDAALFSEQMKDIVHTLLHTQLHKNKKMLKPGMLEVVEGRCMPQKITLQRGINTIGRKATTSDATIQLDTEDKLISRKHLNIDLIMKPDATFEHRLSDAGSRNGTFHNAERMEAEDVIILQPGDTVKIGHTVFRFVAE